MSGQIVVRDLFAGTGWGVACQQLGWEEHGVEIMPEAQATRAAAGMKTVGDDVRDVEPAPGEYEGEIASPSCKRYSAAGNGAGRRALDAVLAGVARYAAGRPMGSDEAVALIGDEDAALTLEPLRIALISRPRFIVWEQVPAVLPVWQACAQVFADRGYSTAVQVLNAEQYGVPQTRRRAILVARRDGIRAAMPTPTHSRYYSRDPQRLDQGVLPWVSMAQALGWSEPLEAVSNYGTGGDPTNRGVRTGNEPAATITSKADRIKLRSGQSVAGVGRAERSASEPAFTVLRTSDRSRWVRPVQAVKSMGSGMVQRYGERPGRPIATPAFTVRAAAGGTEPGGFRWDCVNNTRKLTPEEAAALQTYPPGFPFQGGKGRVMEQIGNAVPPLLALATLRMFDRQVAA